MIPDQDEFRVLSLPGLSDLANFRSASLGASARFSASC
jgi:hypothetical protein